MKNPLKTLEANTLGRDFVVGDIHGCFSAYTKLLAGIQFDPTVDRMISVGDLIDRGHDSLRCLNLLREPYFHSVLSNHEQMMIDRFYGGRNGYYWFRNGGSWGIEAWNDYNAGKTGNRVPFDHSVELIDLLPLVDDLPFLITINTKAGKKYHILHAELPSHTTTVTDELLADPDKLLALATIQRGDGDAFLWARHVFSPFYCANLQDRNKILRTVKYNDSGMFNDNLSHIISGHTILQRPMTILGQTNIDTGAFKSYRAADYPNAEYEEHASSWAGLTCVELDAWQFYQATETTFKVVEPMVITASDIVQWV